jgi:hypothetical protein
MTKFTERNPFGEDKPQRNAGIEPSSANYDVSQAAEKLRNCGKSTKQTHVNGFGSSERKSFMKEAEEKSLHYPGPSNYRAELRPIRSASTFPKVERKTSI